MLPFNGRTDTVLCGNGMAGYEDDDVCCPTECGQCGGAGCSTSGAAAGLGSDSCCYSGVKESKEDCEVTLSPPCVMGEMYSRSVNRWSSCDTVIYRIPFSNERISRAVVIPQVYVLL